MAFEQIIKEIKDIKSDAGHLKKFGINSAILLAVFGAVFFFLHKGIYVHCLGLAAIFLAGGLLWPLCLKPFQKLLVTAGILMGALVSPLIFGLLYYLIITPIGLFLRLTGKDLLDMKIDRQAKSYWITRKTKCDRKSCEKQF
jgi:hypothetical protein